MGQPENLTFNNYQDAAQETAVYPGKEDPIDGGTNIDGLIYTTLGLAGEAGEIANKVKKILRDNDREFSIEYAKQLREECGDVLWYLSETVRQIGYNLGDIAQENIDKLSGRKVRGTIQGSGDDR